jgi:hypothetical protein
MINFYNQVPSVYPNASRDFQYLSWLINIVLNSVKHNVDGMYNLPNTKSDLQLTELLAMTLGFKVKRNYDKDQLIALVSVLPAVLKYKGTELAIRMAANALVNASGSLGDASVEVDGAKVRVIMPKDLSDITLFLDLLDYILPAGMTCHISRKNEERHFVNVLELRHNDVVNWKLTDDVAWTASNYQQEKPSLSTLYDKQQAVDVPITLANIIKLDEQQTVVNTGLIDNNIIPVLADRSTTATTKTDTEQKEL